MLKLRLAGALEFRDDAVGQHFAEFDAPLVERVDIPDGALHKDLVFVERDQLTQRLRCQSLSKNRVCWAVTFKGTMWNLIGLNSVRSNFPGSFTERKCLGLGKKVGHQEIMMTSQRIKRLVKSDE